MALSVKLFAVDGVAYAGGDVQIGEAESLSVPINNGVTILTVPVRRRRLTLNARGMTENQATTLQATRDGNIASLVTNTAPTTATIAVGPFDYTRMYLADYQPSGPIEIESNSLFESLSLVYDSLDWS